MAGTDDHARSWRARSLEERASMDLSQLHHWLACLRARAPSAAVLVVGTHAATDHSGSGCASAAEREALCRKGAEELRQLHPGLRLQVCLVDSATGLGIAAVRSQLALMTLQKEELKSGGSSRLQVLPVDVPRDWLALRLRCRSQAGSMEVPLLSWKSFVDCCGGSCPRLAEAVDFWHALGDLVYFRSETQDQDVVAESDAEMLGDFVVLRPQWLADLLRSVVTQTGATDDIRERGGVVGERWLRARLESAALRGQGVDSGLDLLERFELAIPCTGDLATMVSHVQEPAEERSKPPSAVIAENSASIHHTATECFYLFPAFLPATPATRDCLSVFAPKARAENLNARGVFLLLPPGLRPAGFFSQLLIRALRRGAMVPEAVASSSLTKSRARLRTNDSGVLLELSDEDHGGAVQLHLRAEPLFIRGPGAAGAMDSENLRRACCRRDDALRRALVEVAALVGVSFPGLLPATIGSLADRAMSLLRVPSTCCQESSAGVLLTICEEAFVAQQPLICSGCGAPVDVREALGQPEAFCAKRFRPLLQSSAVSIGLADLLSARHCKTSW